MNSWQARQLRQFFLTTLVFLPIITFSAGAKAGDRGGNGGSGDESQIAAQQAQLESVALKIKYFFIKHEEKLGEVFPEFQANDLVQALERSTPVVVDREVLTDRHGVSRTCLNFRETLEVECSSKQLENVIKPEALFVLVFHEYLGLLGVEETSPKDPNSIEGYSISKRIAPFVSKVEEYDLVVSDKVCKTYVFALNSSSLEREIHYTKEFNEGVLEALRKQGHTVVSDIEDADYELTYGIFQSGSEADAFTTFESWDRSVKKTQFAEVKDPNGWGSDRRARAKLKQVLEKVPACWDL